MSVLIKGMEMPTSCCNCPCVNGNYCAITRYKPKFEEWYKYRPEYCPLVPVPPHGRLIDADELCEGRVSNDNVVICAKAAPTIIPADKEGEG